jgi:hypothetical protein
MWKEILDFNLQVDDNNMLVKDIVAGRTFHRPFGGFVGVANAGRNVNWLGSDLAMANLYGFGRLAWNPNLSARQITERAKCRKELLRRRNQAQAALHFYEERSGREIRNLVNIVRKWAERKEDRALDWLTALWDYTSRGRRLDSSAKRPASSGSIVFYVFLQRVIDQIVERTGGRPITVALPRLVDGEVESIKLASCPTKSSGAETRFSSSRSNRRPEQISSSGRLQDGSLMN